jgi:hypothetical protein
MVAGCRNAGYGFSVGIIRKASPLHGSNRIPMEKKNALASVPTTWQETALCMRLATANPLRWGMLRRSMGCKHGYFVF